MYEAIEHWKQYKQKKTKYPTKQELINKGYEVPGGMILNELIEEEIKSGEYKIIEE
tara:strand:- start:502 stop:669 length:168 start_codon:yes stop_codon:yes gene_type:complete